MVNTLEVIIDSTDSYTISLPNTHITVESIGIDPDALELVEREVILEYGMIRFNLPSEYRWSVEESCGLADITAVPVE